MKTEQSLNEALNLLGCYAYDKMSGMSGTINSVSFDTFGCIQGLLQPKYQDGKLPDCYWLDISRLVINRDDRAMEIPFDFVDPINPSDLPNFEGFTNGPANKPTK